MTGSYGTVFAVIALLTANAFFVAAEFALVKSRGFRIDALVEEQALGARLTQRILRDLEPYLAACQLGITMASLGLGWVGEPAVEAMLTPLLAPFGLSATALHTTSFLTGFVLFSALHIVVGEQVPKTYAIRKPEPVSQWVAYPLHAFYLLVWPLNWLLSRTTSAILRLFGVEEVSHVEVLTGEELRGLISVSREHGHIEDDRAQMFANLFAFDERTVGRVMIPRGDVQALDLQSSEEENARILRESQHSRFPVVDGDAANPVGIVLAKEIYAALTDGTDRPWSRLKDFCREPLVVPESLRIAPLFDTMRARRAHMALVVDEYGSFIGLVTLEDLIEEIVGEISDETDVDDARYDIVTTETGWEAHGLVSLADVHRAIDLDVPPELGANTLSGLLMQRLGRMPEAGDEHVEGGFRLRVLEMKSHRVERVAIEPLAPKGETTDTGLPRPHAGDDTARPSGGGR